MPPFGTRITVARPPCHHRHHWVGLRLLLPHHSHHRRHWVGLRLLLPDHHSHHRHHWVGLILLLPDHHVIIVIIRDDTVSDVVEMSRIDLYFGVLFTPVQCLNNAVVYQN